MPMIFKNVCCMLAAVLLIAILVESESNSEAVLEECAEKSQFEELGMEFGAAYKAGPRDLDFDDAYVNDFLIAVNTVYPNANAAGKNDVEKFKHCLEPFVVGYFAAAMTWD